MVDLCTPTSCPGGRVVDAPLADGEQHVPAGLLQRARHGRELELHRRPRTTASIVSARKSKRTISVRSRSRRLRARAFITRSTAPCQYKAYLWWRPVVPVGAVVVPDAPRTHREAHVYVMHASMTLTGGSSQPAHDRSRSSRTQPVALALTTNPYPVYHSHMPSVEAGQHSLEVVDAPLGEAPGVLLLMPQGPRVLLARHLARAAVLLPDRQRRGWKGSRCQHGAAASRSE